METAVKARKTQMAFPFLIFEEEIINPLGGVELSAIESFIASLLLDATSEKPVKMAAIIEACADTLGAKISERKVKILIRSLRLNHAFPIITRRAKPAGYWWCGSVEEMKEFARLWQSQYFDEMRTLHVMMKHNFPRLAGQMRIADISRR